MSNLNWKTSWQDLKDKFRESGEVVYANVVRDDEGGCHIILAASRARYSLCKYCTSFLQ